MLTKTPIACLCSRLTVSKVTRGLTTYGRSLTGLIQGVFIAERIHFSDTRTQIRQEQRSSRPSFVEHAAARTRRQNS